MFKIEDCIKMRCLLLFFLIGLLPHILNASDNKAELFEGLGNEKYEFLKKEGEKYAFQTEVNRMMKLIVNSLYKNKEIFLRELISNASDALDKIRLLSLTSSNELESNPDLLIKLKMDKSANMLHIIDTGIGMTKEDLVNNLGTIAKSGTADFLSKMQNSENEGDISDMIGQFGVGFYSAFLVADKVVVVTKNNNDKQYIWESDSNSYSIVEDPRGNTLKRGTIISLQLKEEALDFLQEDTIEKLITKYSQFINFPIYMWTSTEVDDIDSVESEDDQDGNVEEAIEKPAKIKKHVWDWKLKNENKPLWTKKPKEVTEEEYKNFYKTLTKDSSDPLSYTHFVAEGEVSFKSLMYIPKVQPSESFNKYGTKTDNIKLYVRRVFITDEFNDIMPNYLNFIRGIVDSDDLPLNVSRETLQQHKLIKVLKKKIVRKVLDMINKIGKEQYIGFWKEYSTNIKLGLMEDAGNRARLAKMLRFASSRNDFTSLTDYVERSQETQEYIYYVAGASKSEVEKSPFVEKLLKKGFEVLYLTEAVDEYCISSIPEYDGKKFQNVAKEGFVLPDVSKSDMENTKKQFEPLLDWFSNIALKDLILKVEISERLDSSPCALVAGMFSWTGNMERLALSNAHQKSDDTQRMYYLNQKKILEINPNHDIIKELLRRIEVNKDDVEAIEIAKILFDTASIRSGFMLKEGNTFATNVDNLLKLKMNIIDDNLKSSVDHEEL